MDEKPKLVDETGANQAASELCAPMREKRLPVATLESPYRGSKIASIDVGIQPRRENIGRRFYPLLVLAARAGAPHCHRRELAVGRRTSYGRSTVINTAFT